MKVVVIGGSGLIGSKVVERLTELGHDAVPASLATGVNTITKEGLSAALAGADVVIDVSNSPSFADNDVMEFFTTSTTHLIEAEQAAGVKHHVALSIVGCDRALHAVLRVQQQHRRRRHGRRQGASPARLVPAGGVR